MFGVGLWRIISLRGGPGMGTQELVVIVVAVALRPGRVQGSEVWEGAEAEADHQVLVAGGCGGDDGGQGQVESEERPQCQSCVSWGAHQPAGLVCCICSEGGTFLPGCSSFPMSLSVACH